MTAQSLANLRPFQKKQGAGPWKTEESSEKRGDS